jgi:hypothetical protein
MFQNDAQNCCEHANCTPDPASSPKQSNPRQAECEFVTIQFVQPQNVSLETGIAVALSIGLLPVGELFAGFSQLREAAFADLLSASPPDLVVLTGAFRI